MRKLIVKTALLTLAVAVVAEALIFIVGATVFPRVFAGLYYDVGFENLSLDLSEKAYKRTEDLSDLTLLVERSVECGDYEKTAFYAPLLLKSEDFFRLSEEKNGEKISDDVGDYEGFIAGSLAVAYYKTGKKGEALSTAVAHSSVYVKYNPVERLIATAIEENDTAFAAEILAQLETLVVSSGTDLLGEDIVLLRDFIGE